MRPAESFRKAAGRRCATLLVVAASLCQPVILAGAGSEPFLHQIAALTGQAEVYTAAVHPGVAAHVESSPVRSHACAFDCYLSSRAPVAPPLAAPFGTMPVLVRGRPAGSPLVLPGADLHGSSPRAPPLL